MKVILLGAGNVATNLGLALYKVGCDILQVYSRTMLSAEKLANELDAEPICSLEKISLNGDIYIFCLKDAVVEQHIFLLKEKGIKRLMIHTSGSLPMNVFKGVADKYGVLYPLQTFSKSRMLNFEDIPCFIEASDEATKKVLVDIAQQISKKVYSLSSEDREYLHLSAVFACNFVNNCYTIAEDIIKGRNLPIEVLYPLIDETARKIHKMSGIKAQTGPAVRYDKNIIAKHLELLKNSEIEKNIYELMSLSIHKKNNNDKL